MQVVLQAVALAGLVLGILYTAWLVMPILYGLPWVPTAYPRVRRALELAQLRPGETLYDLGSGDGRVLLMAANEFGARAVGIELSPLHCIQATWLARRGRSSGQVIIRREDFFKADLQDADVVFAFMTSRQATQLQVHLQAQLRPGTRVVTVSFDLDGWQPVAIDQQDLLFLYHMPPATGDIASYLAQNN